MRADNLNRRVIRLLFWESTVRCNLSCAHCRRIEVDEKAAPDLSTKRAKEMIDQLADLGRMQNYMPILVFSGGEPLCRKDIFELIEYAGQKDLPAALATNGTLLDMPIAKKLKDAGVQRVSVSLDGATAKVHNKLRRQDGSFEAAIAGVKCLREAGVEFQINVTMTKHNADQLDEIFELSKKTGAVAVHLFMLVPVGCGEEFAPEDMLDSNEYERMLTKVAEKEKNAQIEIKVTCAPHYQRVKRQQGAKIERMTKGCLAGLGVMFVSHCGDVFPCGYLPVNCGNILDADLKSIWQSSEELAKMRDTGQLKGKCSMCGYKEVCGGCRARAFAATGDYMDQEPFCNYQPTTEEKT